MIFVIRKHMEDDIILHLLVVGHIRDDFVVMWQGAMDERTCCGSWWFGHLIETSDRRENGVRRRRIIVFRSADFAIAIK
ncbi:hypothetical protein GTP38_01685 [Duganella sp. FT94W]|uniref:Uncharacterized protein n=1 Tax=Duganella lactea TaxID=2692173 RepID=A0ABW9UZY5_9BURK|nr:hypothetical protein [Duganella lactea]MYM33059.1 hypothetical protein [Duganella lactea]